MAPRRIAAPRWLIAAAVVLIAATVGAPPAAAESGAGKTVKPAFCDALKIGPIVRSDVGHVVLGCRASGTAPDALAGRAKSQGWTTLMDDELADLAYKAVIKRVNRAWDAGKATLPPPGRDLLAGAMRHRQDQAYQQLLALNRMVVDGRINKDFKASAGEKEEFANVNTRYAMLQPTQMWDQEKATDYYARLDAAMTADKNGLKDYRDEYDDVTGANASAATRALCAGRTAFSSLVDHSTSRRVKEAQCRANLTKNAKRAVGGAASAVAGWVGEQLWKGIFGPLIKSVNEAATWAATELAKQMDRLVEVNFNRAWMSTLISRSAGVALIVGTLMTLLGLLGAVMRGSGREAGEVLGRAMTIGVVTGMVLAVMQIAGALGTAFTQVMVGPRGDVAGPIGQLTENFTKSMVDGKVPEFMALIFLLLLLLGLVLLMLELAFRGPLLFMLALLYPPIYASSTLRPGRETLQNVNGLIIGLLLVPFVAVLGLSVAGSLAQEAHDWVTLLVAVCALLAASGLPLLMMVLISPAAGFIAGMSGRAAMGQAAKAGRAGAGVGGSAASGAGRAAKVGGAAAEKAARGGGRLAASGVSAMRSRRGGDSGGSGPTADGGGPGPGAPGGSGGSDSPRRGRGGGPAGSAGGRGTGSSAPGAGGAPGATSAGRSPDRGGDASSAPGAAAPTSTPRRSGADATDGAPPGASGASGRRGGGGAPTGGPAPRSSGGGRPAAPKRGNGARGDAPRQRPSGGGAPKSTRRPPAGPKGRGGRKPPPGRP